MCIMEVRPGQRSSTIAQAMAHNLSTIERDLDMFKPLLVARGETELLRTVEAGHEAMKVAYARFLECFTHEIEHEIRHHGDGQDDHEHGNERAPHEHIHPVDQHILQDAMVVAAHSAERYETR